MKKTPGYMTGETQQTPPPSRFTPLAGQSKARVVPPSASTSASMKGQSSTPMRVPTHQQSNQSRLAVRKQQAKTEHKMEENTPKSSLTSKDDDSMVGTKMVRVSPYPSEERGEAMVGIRGQSATTQLLNHSIQITELQRQVEELEKANKRLTEINDQQAATIQEIANVVMDHKIMLQKLEALSTILGSMVPAPVSLNFQRHSPDAVIIAWESSIVPLAVQSYELSLNGVPSGQVAGKSRRAILSPLNPAQDYRVSVQAVSQFNDIRSVKTEVVIPRLQEDDSGNKENVDESMGERMSTR